MFPRALSPVEPLPMRSAPRLSHPTGARSGSKLNVPGHLSPSGRGVQGQASPVARRSLVDSTASSPSVGGAGSMGGVSAPPHITVNNRSPRHSFVVSTPKMAITVPVQPAPLAFDKPTLHELPVQPAAFAFDPQIAKALQRMPPSPAQVMRNTAPQQTTVNVQNAAVSPLEEKFKGIVEAQLTQFMSTLEESLQLEEKVQGIVEAQMNQLGSTQVESAPLEEKVRRIVDAQLQNFRGSVEESMQFEARVGGIVEAQIKQIMGAHQANAPVAEQVKDIVEAQIKQCMCTHEETAPLEEQVRTIVEAQIEQSKCAPEASMLLEDKVKGLVDVQMQQFMGAHQEGAPLEERVKGIVEVQLQQFKATLEESMPLESKVKGLVELQMQQIMSAHDESAQLEERVKGIVEVHMNQIKGTREEDSSPLEDQVSGMVELQINQFMASQEMSTHLEEKVEGIVETQVKQIMGTLEELVKDAEKAILEKFVMPNWQAQNEEMQKLGKRVQALEDHVGEAEQAIAEANSTVHEIAEALAALNERVKEQGIVQSGLEAAWTERFNEWAAAQKDQQPEEENVTMRTREIIITEPTLIDDQPPGDLGEALGAALEDAVDLDRLQGCLDLVQLAMCPKDNIVARGSIGERPSRDKRGEQAQRPSRRAGRSLPNFDAEALQVRVELVARALGTFGNETTLPSGIWFPQKRICGRRWSVTGVEAGGELGPKKRPTDGPTASGGTFPPPSPERRHSIGCTSGLVLGADVLVATAEAATCGRDVDLSECREYS